MSETTRIKWHQSPIDPALFKTLCQRSDAKALRHVLAHLALVVMLGAFSHWAFMHLPLYAGIFFYLVFTNVFNFLGQTSAIHELSHGTVFESKTLNRFFTYFLGFITWSDPVFYKNSHIKHHQFTAHHGLEKEVELPMTLRVRDFMYSLVGNPYITYRTFFTYLRRALGVIKGEWEEMIFPEEAVKKRQALIRWNRVLITGHLVIAAVIVASGHYLLLLYITYPIYSSSILSHLVTMTQHTGLQPDVPDSRKCCRSVTLPRWYAFLYWQMNYHIEHHMYAAVPFYNLPKLHKALAADMPEMKGLVTSYREMLAIQKRQKVEPDYYYEQVCP